MLAYLFLQQTHFTHPYHPSHQTPQNWPKPISSTSKPRSKEELLRATPKSKRCPRKICFWKAITWAEGKHSTLTKCSISNKPWAIIDWAQNNHICRPPKQSIPQTTKNWKYALETDITQWPKHIESNNPHVKFSNHCHIQNFNKDNTLIMVTYDSGANNHYISETDQAWIGLSILCKSTRHVGVANCSNSQGIHLTQLSFHNLLIKVN